MAYTLSNSIVVGVWVVIGASISIWVPISGGGISVVSSVSVVVEVLGVSVPLEQPVSASSVWVSGVGVVESVVVDTIVVGVGAVGISAVVEVLGVSLWLSESHGNKGQKSNLEKVKRIFRKSCWKRKATFVYKLTRRFMFVLGVGLRGLLPS